MDELACRVMTLSTTATDRHSHRTAGLIPNFETRQYNTGSDGRKIPVLRQLLI